MTNAAADEAIGRLASPADVRWHIEMAGHRVFALTYMGQFAEVDAVIGDVMRVAEEVGNAPVATLAPIFHAWASVHRSGDLAGLEARAREVVARESVFGPFAYVGYFWVAMSQAERGDPEGALASATQGRRAFPPENQWAGLLAGSELRCLALLHHPDWALRLKECEHFVPVAGTSNFAGRRWFALPGALPCGPRRVGGRYRPLSGAVRDPR